MVSDAKFGAFLGGLVLPLIMGGRRYAFIQLCFLQMDESRYQGTLE